MSPLVVCWLSRARPDPPGGRTDVLTLLGLASDCNPMGLEVFESEIYMGGFIKLLC